MNHHRSDFSSYSFDELVDEYLQLNAKYRYQIARPVKQWDRAKCEELKAESESLMSELDKRRRVTVQAEPSLV